MRFRLGIALALLTFASSAFGIERWILVSGTVGAFHTDARILNPSFDKEITIEATFLPRRNTNNSGRTPVSFVIPKRQMRVMNDVTSELFSTTDLGAIRFTSADEFEITSRIYAVTPTNFCPTPGGTLGQFGPGLPTSSAKAKGALLQLKVGGGFRTNMGVLNPNSEQVSIEWTLYAKNNGVAATGMTVMEPLGVIDPLPLNGGFFFTPAPESMDLTDAWLSFKTTNDKPVFIYGSVIDNNTTDQTFISAVDDKGVAPPPPNPTLKEHSVSLEDFSITISPAVSGLKTGDTVKFRINNEGPSAHGFILVGPNGQTLINVMPAVGSQVDSQFTIQSQGTYTYACANSACGVGHTAMVGSFVVGASTDRDCPPYCY